MIVPVYGNAPTLVELHRRLGEVFQRSGLRHECIFVNDASPDDSADVLSSLSHLSDVRVVTLAANVGQHRAVLHGLAYARGSTACILDADLQDPPEVIPALLDRLVGGVAAVYAAREGHFEPWFRRFTSRLFRYTIKAQGNIPVGLGLFGVMDRRMVERLLGDSSGRPFVPAMMVRSGLTLDSVPVQRLPRPIGRSAYTSWKRLTMALSVIGSLWRRPAGEAHADRLR